MKTKALTLFFLAFALTFTGCSTTPTVRPATRVKAVRPSKALPPMPPGFKAKAAQAGLRQAAPPPAPATAYVPGSPMMTGPTPWDGQTSLVTVWQETNHSTTVYQRQAVGDAKFEIAVFGCNTGLEGQWVGFTVGSSYPALFVEAWDTNCVGGYVPPGTAVTAAPAERSFGAGRQVTIKGVKHWMLRLPDTGYVPRFVFKKVPPPK